MILQGIQLTTNVNMREGFLSITRDGEEVFYGRVQLCPTLKQGDLVCVSRSHYLHVAWTMGNR